MKRYDNSGLTLIEMIIYTAILSIVVVGLVRFALTLTGDRSRSVIQAEVEGNARALSETLRHYVRYSRDVVVPASATTSNLILDMPSGAPDITVLIDSNGQVKFGEEGIGTTTVTSDEVNVSSLEFVNTSASSRRDVIRIIYTISYDVGGDSLYERTYSTTATRRR